MITVIVFLISFVSVQSQIYLYDTYDGFNIEYYDCLFVESLFYCRRPHLPINLTRDNDALSCQQNNGSVHRFDKLQLNKININTILQEWKSSIEQIERYAQFLMYSFQTNEYICQCNEQSSFGKNCEYRLPQGTSFNQMFHWLAKMKKADTDRWQIYDNIICYETLICNSGLLCLDWREICDGIEQCMYGYDEQNCDLLEMNNCDVDEYRCMNGICIPDEYFLDGDFDCLDWSDEMQHKRSNTCVREMASTQCEDHICLSNEFSCGDGQCIPLLDISLISTRYAQCFNERDQYYRCETHPSQMKWTMLDGRCLFINKIEERYTLNSTNETECEFMLRCALSKGGHINCPCWRDETCAKKLSQICPMPFVRYQEHALVTGYISFLYDRSGRITPEKDPSLVSIDGTIKCANTLVYINRTIPFKQRITIRHIVQDLCANQMLNISSQCYRTNESSDVCHEVNLMCLSVTRLNDGFNDCLKKQDEANRIKEDIKKTCSHVKHHRFHCSNEQPTCLNIMALGNSEENCANKFDELWFGRNRKLTEMKCIAKSKADCLLLRQYIQQSWLPNNQTEIISKSKIPFRFYCNTFWDLELGVDENITECQQEWVCDPEQERCDTGQCIEPDWESDYDRDCTDGSDLKLFYQEQITHALDFVQNEDINVNQSYFLVDTCHSENFFLCLSSTQISSPQFVCLNQSQVGDGKIDCLGAVDESHTIRHCSSSMSMLGNYFLCPSTNTCIPYLYHCQTNYRCPNRSDDKSWCSRQVNFIDCNDEHDFTCFDGQCISFGRCNQFFECPFGEDEYMCDYESQEMKHAEARMSSKTFQLPRFPTTINASRFSQATTNNSITEVNFTKTFTRQLIAHCNRGIGIWLLNRSIVCFCPPQYYGDKCQYHADRLSILFHLNFSQSIYRNEYDRKIVLQIVIHVLFNNEILMIHRVHVRPALETIEIKKNIVYFVYSHSDRSRHQRQQRFNNRSSVIQSQPYSIRIEAYEPSRVMLKPSLIAVWQFPIQFDYLPVYRVAKVLRLIDLSQQSNPCSSNPCNVNEECQPMMNNPNEYLCLCKPNLFGENCFREDQQCAKGYCAEQSICKPISRPTSLPYCLCPLNRYGDRCHLEYDPCQSNPCLNGGSCLSTEQLDEVICLCTKEFYGLKCELKKSFIRLFAETNHPHSAVVLQFFDIDSTSHDLILAQQQVFQIFPRLIEFYREEQTAPSIVLSKFYSSRERLEADIYLLLIRNGVAFVEGQTHTSSANRCPYIHQLVNNSLPIRYHEICRFHTKLLCFHDNVYLCTCIERTNMKRAECFLYDDQLDHCSHCLVGGRCFKGDHRKSSDFLCLCPPCYAGQQCQFSTKSFTFTLDQLFYTDLMSVHQQRTMILLLVFSLLSFAIGILNNICSFLTFRRTACLKYGVGHYLLYLSIINQINLGLFLARLSHIIINMAMISSSSIVNHIFCKIFNYSLLSSSRIVFWLSSLIAIERVYTATIINDRWLNQPRMAHRLMIFSIVGILFVTGYELVFYHSHLITDENPRSMCVFEFPINSRSLWTIIHMIISSISTLFPILINICSSITIIVVGIRNKMNTLKSKKHKYLKQSKSTPSINPNDINCRQYLRFLFDVLKENKELVVGPSITLIPQLCSLPFFISSFILDCQNIENSWLRYLLIISYWSSFVPQMISFFLYISPSSTYSAEWHKTKIRQWMKTLF